MLLLTAENDMVRVSSTGITFMPNFGTGSKIESRTHRQHDDLVSLLFMLLRKVG
jgi:hypothetical protein